jgi:hypothetical protein
MTAVGDSGLHRRLLTEGARQIEDEGVDGWCKRRLRAHELSGGEGGGDGIFCGALVAHYGEENLQKA